MKRQLSDEDDRLAMSRRKTDSESEQRAKRRCHHRLVRIGLADFQCNACGEVVKRDLGWKLWTPSYCESTGKKARLYRISAPSEPKHQN